MSWPEPPCGCRVSDRCPSCGVCSDCYGCECPRPAADEALTIDDTLAYITEPVRAVGRARNAPASNARIRRPSVRPAGGPPPHVGPPPVTIAPAEPVAPPPIESK